MDKVTKLFLDTEFTGLQQDTDLISIGIVSDGGMEFYAEFTDYDRTKINDWLQRNVVDNLLYNKFSTHIFSKNNNVENIFENTHIKGDTKTITEELKKWLDQFTSIEIWSDCLAYDWVLFSELFGSALNIPGNVYYIPFDICTMFKMKGIDPDISREDFSQFNMGLQDRKHNSLYDAKVIKACYEKLISMK